MKVNLKKILGLDGSRSDLVGQRRSDVGRLSGAP